MLLSLLFLLQTALAQSACISDANDPFEPHETGRGSFEGKCLDTSTVRPLKILDDRPDSMSVVNVYYYRRWWKAEIAKNLVRQVYYQIVPFESGIPLVTAAHTQFRFQLKRPLQLTAQSGDPVVASLDDVIISSTFTAPPGEKYEALKSFSGSYGLVTRLLGTLDRAREEILVDKSIVRQFRIKITEDEANRLFYTLVKMSADEGYTKPYRILGNNCATKSFDALDTVRVRPSGVYAMRGSLWNWRDLFVKPALDALMDRKMITGLGDEVHAMNYELNCDPVPHTCNFKNR